MENLAIQTNFNHLNFGQTAVVIAYLKRPIVPNKGKWYLTKGTPLQIENADVTIHLGTHLLLILDMIVIVIPNLKIAAVTSYLVNTLQL